MHKLCPVFAAAALAMAAPAVAGETTINYTGAITATPDPTQAFGLTVGTPISFSATFDPGQLVDRTATFFNIDAISGRPVAIDGLRTASLFDDPNASFIMTIGADTLTIADDPNAGNGSLGVGHQPVAVYQNATFVGVAYAGLAADGLFVDVDPIALALHYFPATGIGFDVNSNNPGFGLLISTDLPTLQVTSVPEPATWALAICGAAFAGGAIRRRRAARARLAPT